MTVGYLIIADNAGSEPQPREASQLALVHRDQNLSVWSDTMPISIGPGGWIFGHLFTRTVPSTRIDILSESEIRRIIETTGAHLIDAYWGGYIAVLRTSGGEIQILRDPSGTVPCFFSRAGTALAVSNDAMSLIRLNKPHINVDFQELARFIASPDWAGRETCLTGISELIGGEALMWSAGRVDTHALWSPWRFAKQTIAGTDTANRLLDILGNTIGTWASCFSQIAIGVSGGLDSSIVAACSGPKDNGVRFFTMVGPDADGDETRYAQLLVDSFGASLQRFGYDVADIAIDRPTLPHHPRPSAAYFAQSIESAHRQLAVDRPFDALFVGNGGDGVFCSTRAATPLTDRWLAEGVGRGTYETLRDIGQLTDASTLEIVRQAARRRLTRATVSEPKCDFTGLRGDCVSAIGHPRRRHPWMIESDGALPGKIAHVASVMRSQKNISFYRHGDGPPQIAPLLSQPIVEACLGIPTWQWISGGIDRATARNAVRDLLPQPIVDRTSKGGPDGFMHLLCRVRWHKLTEFLRAGVLINEGLIDPEFLDRPFDPGWKGKTTARRLLSFGAAESWTRYWLRVGEEE